MTSEARRLLAASAILLGAFAALAAKLIVMAGVHATAIARTPFEEARMLRALSAIAAHEGAIERGDDGAWKTADAAWVAAACAAEGVAVASAEARYPFIDEDGGVLTVDPSAVRVSNPRLYRSTTPRVRGRILDANGRLLAGPDPAFIGSRSDAPRVHPLGAAAFPLVGVSRPGFGRTGLEQDLDPWLNGDEQGSTLTALRSLAERERRGGDVVLTLDGELQREAFGLLADRRGAIVILDCRSAAILAAASAPSFDPATPAGPAWRIAERDRIGRPFTDRALHETEFPGSTFKVALAAAWLSRHGAGSDFTTTCAGGRHPTLRVREHGNARHGRVGLQEGLAVSCNHLFAELAVREGAQQTEPLQRMGFNRRLDVSGLAHAPSWTARSVAFAAGAEELAGGDDPWAALDARAQVAQAFAASGTLPADEPPDPGLPARAEDAAWFQDHPGVVAQAGIGQNVVRCTPLELATLAAMVGARGTWREPRIVDHVTDARGRTIARPKESAGVRVLSDAEARVLGRAMERVMTAGTGRGVAAKAGFPAMRVAGKTGTAEVGNFAGDVHDADESHRPHSWFIGYAPADAPRVAVAVLIENAGFGSEVAAPLGVKALARALELHDGAAPKPAKKRTR